MDMLWAPGDLVISMPAQNSQTQPKPKTSRRGWRSESGWEIDRIKKPTGLKTDGSLVGPAPGPVSHALLDQIAASLCYPDTRRMRPQRRLWAQSPRATEVQVTGFPLIVLLAGSRSRLRNRAGSASPASSIVHKSASRRQDAYRFHAAKLLEASHLPCRWVSDSGRSASE